MCSLYYSIYVVLIFLGILQIVKPNFGFGLFILDKANMDRNHEKPSHYYAINTNLSLLGIM